MKLNSNKQKDEKMKKMPLLKQFLNIHSTFLGGINTINGKVLIFDLEKHHM